MIGEVQGDRPNRDLSFCLPLTLFILAGSATTASAQEDKDLESQYQPDEVPACNVASASRTRQECGVDSPVILSSETEFTLSLELEAPSLHQCEMRIDSEYTQRDTIARVTGAIDNETCSASSGNYEIEVRVRDPNGDVQLLVFSESWQRDDDQPVTISADYPIGEDVELIRLRSRGLRCTCLDATSE